MGGDGTALVAQSVIGALRALGALVLARNSLG
jgi:hypothetical protein